MPRPEDGTAGGAPVRPAVGERPGDGERTPAPAGARGRLGRRWIWIAALAMVIAVGGGWWFVGRSGGGERREARAPAAQPVPVEVANAETSDLPIYLEGLGTVQAFNTVVVRSRVEGELMTVNFQEGQIVREGDLLAQIDPRPYQAALDQTVAKKQQDEATRGSNRTDLARTQELASRGFAPRQQLDQQTASVGAIDAQIAIDQAQIDNAKVQLDYTTVRAPISGRTGLRLTDRGNIVRASDQTGIVEIAQTDPISVMFTAPERLLPDIAASMRAGPVEVIALRSDGKGELARGKLALINNEVDAASGTVRLKATFANPEDRLWPGLSVNTRLLLRILQAAVTVPEDAVQRGPADLFVFAVKDGTAEHRKVKIGPFAEGRAVVQEGVAAGESVVVAGHSRLKDKTKVDTGRPRQDVAEAAGGGAATTRPDAVTR